MYTDSILASGETAKNWPYGELRPTAYLCILVNFVVPLVSPTLESNYFSFLYIQRDGVLSSRDQVFVLCSWKKSQKLSLYFEVRLYKVVAKYVRLFVWPKFAFFTNVTYSSRLGFVFRSLVFVLGKKVCDLHADNDALGARGRWGRASVEGHGGVTGDKSYHGADGGGERHATSFGNQVGAGVFEGFDRGLVAVNEVAEGR